MRHGYISHHHIEGTGECESIILFTGLSVTVDRSTIPIVLYWLVAETQDVADPNSEIFWTSPFLIVYAYI